MCCAESRDLGERQAGVSFNFELRVYEFRAERAASGPSGLKPLIYWHSTYGLKPVPFKTNVIKGH